MCVCVCVSIRSALIMCIMSGYVSAPPAHICICIIIHSLV